MVGLKLRYSIVVECWQTNLHVIVCKCVCWGCNKMRIGQKWAAAPKLFCCAAKMKHQKFRSPPAFFNESKEGASQSTTTISLPAFHWAYERKVLEILWASKGKKYSEKTQSKKYRFNEIYGKCTVGECAVWSYWQTPDYPWSPRITNFCLRLRSQFFWLFKSWLWEAAPTSVSKS